MSVPEDWTDRIAWMRAQGVRTAKWSEQDPTTLVFAELGPEPAPPVEPLKPESPEEIQARLDALMYGAA